MASILRLTFKLFYSRNYLVAQSISFNKLMVLYDHSHCLSNSFSTSWNKLGFFFFFTILKYESDAHYHSLKCSSLFNSKHIIPEGIIPIARSLEPISIIYWAFCLPASETKVTNEKKWKWFVELKEDLNHKTFIRFVGMAVLRFQQFNLSS